MTGTRDAGAHRTARLDTARSKLKHGKGWIENMDDIVKEETEGCAGSAGFSRSRAGVHREHGLVLQPRGV